MSVVCWDGETLAADKRISIGTLIMTTTKIFQVRDCLVGYTGDVDAGEEMLAWFKEGAKPTKFPEAQRDRERYAGLLVITQDKSILHYECTPYPTKFLDKKIAFGCGRDFAIAAMYLGKSAHEAVQVACIFDSACGNGVDELTFNKPAPH